VKLQLTNARHDCGVDRWSKRSNKGSCTTRDALNVAVCLGPTTLLVMEAVDNDDHAARLLEEKKGGKRSGPAAATDK
jgi:hypothetical protein